MTIEELKILLALNGNNRLAHLEEEIFSCEDLYVCYLESICSMYEWYRYYDPEQEGEQAWLAYAYAREVIKGRWIEAESVIITSPMWACHYAEHVIKGRWLEAESVIATHPAGSYYYARDVIKGRWPEAECVIATDREYATRYNDLFGTSL